MSELQKMRSDRFVHLVNAQIEVNRAVALYNTWQWKTGAAFLDPADYSEDAIDAKIRQAIEALNRCLASPRRHRPRSTHGHE